MWHEHLDHTIGQIQVNLVFYLKWYEYDTSKKTVLTKNVMDYESFQQTQLASVKFVI